MDLATLQLKIQSQGIDKGKSDLQGLQAEASKAEKSAQRLDAAFGNLGKAIGGALAFVGVGASLKSTIDAITGFQDSMLQLQATSRATASEMAAMEKQARILGATSKYSASQAADAQNFLAMAGFKTGEVLAATGDVIKFASAANIGLAQSADIASNVLGQMKLPVTQLSGVMDTFISTAQSSNTNVTQLAEAFGYVGPVAAAAGVSTEELAAAIGVLGDAGIQGGRAGTGLQGVIRGLLNVTPAAAEAMSKYGLSIADVDITTHGLTEVLTRLQGANISAGDSMKIFGSESASAALNLASAADRVGELTKANEEAAGRTQEVANILDSGLSAALKSIASAAEESMLIMGESGLASALQTLAVATAGVISNFNGLLPEFAEANGLSDEFTRKIEIASTGVKVLGVGLGALALTAIPAVTSSVVAMTAAIAANPIGLLAVGAAAVVAYFISISDEVDKFNSELDALGAAWDIYADIFTSFWGGVLDMVRPVFGGIIDWFGDMWDNAVEATDGVELSFESALLGIAKVFDGIVSAASGAFYAVVAGAKAATQNLLNYFHNAGERIKKAMFDMAAGAIDAIGSIPFVSIETNLADYKMEIREAINISAAMGEAFEGAATTTAQAAVKSAIELRRLARGTEELNDALDASTESYEDLTAAIDAEWNGTKKSTQATKENTKETDSNTSSTVRNTKAVTEAQKAIEALEKERKAAISAQRDTISGLKDESASLRDQISTYGQGKWAIEKLAIARLEEQKAALIMMGAQQDTIDLLRQEIEERKELLSLGKTLGDMEEETRAYEEMAAEATRMNEEIGRTLTDALMRGFEDGKSFAKNMRDTVINMFRTMVLRPIIEPVTQGVAGAITGALGLGGQGGGGALGLPGAASNINSLVGAFSGSLVSSMGSGIASLGSAFGSSALSSFAAGMKGSTLAAGLAGPTTAGAGGAMGAGAAFGAAMPWVAGGLAVASLLPSLNKMFKGETRYGGGFVKHADNRAEFIGGPSGGYGDIDAMDQVLSAFDSSITGVLDALRVENAYLANTVGSFESSKKGRGGTSSGGTLIIDGKEVYFGSAVDGQTTKGAGYGGRSGSAEEMFESMTKDMAYSTLEAWRLVADQMPSIIEGMLSGVDIRALTAEQAEAMVQQISGTVQQVTAFSEALSILPFDNLAGLSFDLNAALLEASGGMEAMLGNLSTFYTEFYSESERSAIAAGQFIDAMADLGVRVPGTARGFRDLVNSIDITDEASAELHSTLLGLSGVASGFYQAQTENSRKHYDKLKADATAAYEAQTKAIRDSYARQSKAIRSSISSVNEKLRGLRRISSVAASGMEALLNVSEAAQAVAREQSRETVRGALELARAGKSLSGVDGLSEAVSSVSKLKTDSYATLADFERERLTSLHELAELAGYADDQVDVQEMQLNALEKQMEQLDAWRDRSLAAAEAQHTAMLEYYDEQFAKEQRLEDERHADSIEKMLKEHELMIKQMEQDGTIADTLGGTISAGDSAIVRAINAIDMRPIINITTTSAPAFANGGYHRGGSMLVGERGPELLNTGPARIHDANKTKSLLGNEELKKEMKEVKEVLAHYLPAIADGSKGTEHMMCRWNFDGMPEQREMEVY